MLRALQTLAFVVLLCVLFGCGGITSSSSNGTLAFLLADAPTTGVTEVNITVDRVEAHIDGEWVTITAPQESYNLLELTQQAAPLGSASVPAGTYTQVRVFISDASVVDEDGTHDVMMPSVDQTGIKLNVDYTVEPGKITTILLDFNVDRSLVLRGDGEYLLTPVIGAVVQVLSGTIAGTVMMDGDAVQGANVTAIYEAGDNYPVGTEVNTSVTDENGMFKIWALLPGTYTVSVAQTGDGDQVVSEATIEGVTVTADTDTVIDDVSLTAVDPAP
ncbi:MAG: DUF4382 domain-containing protein [Armatimonadetes bacterium]|nr:DUF4382 domain-containing protein [Armatimonadota bacterium]